MEAATVDVGAQDLAGAASEELGDFARVGAMVGAVEPAPGVPVPEQEPERPKMDAAESMAGLLSAVSGAAGFVGFRNVAGLWTPEVCAEGAAKAVPVLRKYPWGARIIDFFETGSGAEEMALGAFMVPMGFATWQAIKADLAKPEQDKPAKQQKQDAPATVTVQPPEDLGGMVEVHGHANG